MRFQLPLIVGLLVAVGLPPVAWAESYEIEGSVPKEQGAAEILGEYVVAKQGQRYIGWPDIVCTPDGELIAVFSGDRDWHVCPWGKVTAVRTVDGGKTWSEPEVMLDTPLDDRGTGLAVLPGGELYLSFHASLAFAERSGPRYDPYKEHSATIGQDVREKWGGFWGYRSEDGGKTWNGRVEMPAMTPHGPTRLDDGRLLVIGGGEAYESKDEGRTWTEIGQFPRNPDTWKSRYAFMSEATCLQVEKDRIIALARYADGDDIELRQSVSEDGGKTWTEPSPRGCRGIPRTCCGWTMGGFWRAMGGGCRRWASVRASARMAGGRGW